jgi:hypothetical protein
VTWQSDHGVADYPMTDETLPDEPLPAQPLPAQPLPAQVVTDEPMTGARAMESHDPDLVIVDSGTDFSNLTDVSNGTVAAEPAAGGGLSEQWHDIQAMFVDDPRGSVERAAQEAEAAVSALVESLRQRQAALAPAGTSTSASDTDASDTDASDTEQLRTALRGYRVLCERLVGLEEQLPRTGAMTR